MLAEGLIAFAGTVLVVTLIMGGMAALLFWLSRKFAQAWLGWIAWGFVVLTLVTILVYFLKAINMWPANDIEMPHF